MLHPGAFRSWQSIVHDRFFLCVDCLISEEIAINEAEVIYKLQISPDDLLELKNSRKNLSIKSLYFAYSHYHLSPLFILTGQGNPFISNQSGTRYIETLNKIVFSNVAQSHKHYLFADSRKKQLFKKFSTNNSIQKDKYDVKSSYNLRNQIWKLNSHHPQNAREVGCIWSQESLLKVLKNRGFNSEKWVKEYELVEGDFREVCLISTTDFIPLPSDWKAEKVLLILESDPIWFWPNSSYYYCAVIQHQLHVGCFDTLEEVGYILFISSLEEERIIERTSIQAIWRIERYW